MSKKLFDPLVYQALTGPECEARIKTVMDDVAAAMQAGQCPPRLGVIVLAGIASCAEYGGQAEALASAEYVAQHLLPLAAEVANG